MREGDRSGLGEADGMRDLLLISFFFGRGGDTVAEESDIRALRFPPYCIKLWRGRRGTDVMISLVIGKVGGCPSSASGDNDTIVPDDNAVVVADNDNLVLDNSNKSFACKEECAAPPVVGLVIDPTK